MNELKEKNKLIKIFKKFELQTNLVRLREGVVTAMDQLVNLNHCMIIYVVIVKNVTTLIVNFLIFLASSILHDDFETKPEIKIQKKKEMK